MLVYTAGHIRGLHYDLVTGWVRELGELLDDSIKIITPMRTKEFLKGTVITGTYEDDLMANRWAVVMRDKYDVRRCDVLVANLDLLDKVSIGTVCEITIAYELRKPVILIMSDLSTNKHNHPFLTQEAGWIVKDIEEAAYVLNT
jgi:nucleoside 2-deoxyribosyltransferase